MKNETIIHISSSSVIKTILIAFSAYLIWYLRDLLLLVLASIVIASAIEPMALYLVKHRIPRVLSVLIVYISFFAVLIGTILFVVPPVLQETKDLLVSVPGLIENLGIDKNESLNNSFAELANETSVLLDAVQNKNFIGAASLLFGGIAGLVLIIVFSFYFAINEKGIEEFLRVLSPRRYEKYVVNLWRRAQNKIGLWMQGQLLLAVLIGTLVYLGLSILGMPYALPLAILAAVLELIPVFGPILSAIPAVAIAFASGGLAMALLVAGLYIIIQQFENHLIYPLVVTKVVGVPPVISILALLVGAKLAGILGVLLSIPLAAVLQELFADMGKYKNNK